MTQPHPPIPEPQPHGEPHLEPAAGTAPAAGSRAASLADDDPRTQSILLPPGQRQEALQTGTTPAVDPQAFGQQPGPGRPATGPIAAQPSTGALPSQPDHGVSAPTYQPASEGSYQPSSSGPYQPDSTSSWQSGAQPSWNAGHQPSYDTAHQPSYDPSTSQVTGPVHFVPGFPPGPAHPAGSTTASPPPVPGPSTAPGSVQGTSSGSPLGALRRAGRDRTSLLGVGLVVVALVLLEIGLARDFGNLALWDVVPTWSAFATLALLVVLVPFVARLAGRGLPAGTAWRIGAVGLAGLAAFWVLVALPLVASDRGFWLTAALGAAGAALWLAPGRSE